MVLKSAAVQASKKHLVYISLGSNIGNKNGHLKQAREAIAKLPGLTVLASSKIYSTEPQDFKDQAWFANQVLALSCVPAITAEGLLESLLYIETSLGRKRPSDSPNDSPEDNSAEGTINKGPRVIDLDLLLFDAEERNSSFLQLPHPRLAQRAFVLVPLFELAPTLCLPCGNNIAELLKALPYSLENGKITQA